MSDCVVIAQGLLFENGIGATQRSLSFFFEVESFFLLLTSNSPKITLNAWKMSSSTV